MSIYLLARRLEAFTIPVHTLETTQPLGLAVNSMSKIFINEQLDRLIDAKGSKIGSKRKEAISGFDLCYVFGETFNASFIRTNISSDC